MVIICPGPASMTQPFQAETSVRAAQEFGNISFEYEAIADEHPDARELIAFWSSKRCGDQLPFRAAIQPADFVKLLPSLFIAEAKGSDWYYRLVGTGIAGRFRVDLTGKSVGEAFEPARAEQVARFYHSVAQGREPVSTKGRYLGLGIDHATVQNVHLPILGPDGRTVWILGGVFFFALVPWHWGPARP